MYLRMQVVLADYDGAGVRVRFLHSRQGEYRFLRVHLARGTRLGLIIGRKRLVYAVGKDIEVDDCGVKGWTEFKFSKGR